jgi:hypothetical protein
VAQDHVNGDLLFAGTEFGLWFTNDGGRQWTQLRGQYLAPGTVGMPDHLPTMQVRDLKLHRRESDVVMATFGRGFYILDDYSALREITPTTLAEEARLYPLRHAYQFQAGGVAPAGAAGVHALSGNYSTPNPPIGAYITYHVRNALPAEEKLVLTISDTRGALIRRCELDKTAGLRRITWNLMTDPQPVAVAQQGANTPDRPVADTAAAAPPAQPAQPTLTSCSGGGAGGVGGRGGGGGGGGGGQAAAAQPQRVLPGVYRASIGKLVGTQLTTIGPAQTFSVLALPEPQR